MAQHCKRLSREMVLEYLKRVMEEIKKGVSMQKVVEGADFRTFEENP